MKKSKFRLLWMGIIEIVIGLGLVACRWAGVLADEFWNGMGTTLVVMGVIFLLRGIKYRKDEAYKEAVDTEANDERNKFLAMKTWSWVGYLFVLIAAVASIVFRIVGLKEYSGLMAYCICLMALLYWIIYMILRKKY